MNEHQYDCIIIGGGPGGYLAAERAGQAGLKVLLCEERELGGVCLNEGCIPTKTLLNAAKLYHHARHSEQFGVHCEKVRFDLGEIMAWKQKVIETQRKGIAFQMKQHGVEVVQARASLSGPDTVEVDGRSLSGKNIILASGSSAVRLPIPGGDQPAVLTNREILELGELPRSLAVIGGGIIGIEFATFFSRVGVEVAVVELLPEIAPSLDVKLASGLRKSLPEVKFFLGSEVKSIDGRTLTFLRGGKEETLEAELFLMSVGRRPNCAGLGLERAGVEFSRAGIGVSERMETNVPGIYAVGDVTGKSLLAHSAYRMADVAVNTILGRPDRMRYDAIPWVVYSDPEIASVGLSEEEARARGLEVSTAELLMRTNGRYLAEKGMDKTSRGFCRLVVDKASERLLGVQMMGSPASEMIFGAAAMIESELRVRDIREVVFPHPTVSEIIKDALSALK
jgi:dihydrolipoamide dehydrogenase